MKCPNCGLDGWYVDFGIDQELGVETPCPLCGHPYVDSFDYDLAIMKQLLKEFMELKKENK